MPELKKNEPLNTNSSANWVGLDQASITYLKKVITNGDKDHLYGKVEVLPVGIIYPVGDSQICKIHTSLLNNSLGEKGKQQRINFATGNSELSNGTSALFLSYDGSKISQNDFMSLVASQVKEVNYDIKALGGDKLIPNPNET